MKASVLKGFFASQAEHHVKCAKLHKNMAEFESGPHKKFHEAMQESHADAAESCIECAKSQGDDLAAAAGGKFGMTAARDFSDIEPTRAHATIPDNPLSKLVPRPGQPLVLPDDAADDVTAHLDRSMGRW